MSGFIGAGDVYIELFDTATATFKPAAGPFNTNKLELKVNGDIKEQTSKGKSNYGQTISSVAIPKPADFAIELGQADKTTLEMSFLATATAINTGSGQVADEAVIAVAGAWVNLSTGNLSDVAFSVKSSDGVKTFVKDIDYHVNYRLGMILAVPGAGIADKAPLKVSFSFNAVTGTRLSGSKKNQVKARIRFDGVNLADSLPVLVTVHQAILLPDSAFDVLGSDFAKVSLKGRMETPAGKAEPFTVDLLDTTA